MPLSTRRNFKLLGILLIILGAITVIYVAFFMQASQYNIELYQGDQPVTVSGTTPFQKLVVGFVGGAMIFLGYRSYRFIPPAEREKEQVSELDLYDNDES